MNNFIVFVNGALVSTDMFDVTTSSTGEWNVIAEATCRADQKFPGAEMRALDVFEMRGGLCVRRYRYDRPAPGPVAVVDKHVLHVPASESEIARTRFRCLSVPNAF